MDCENGRAGLYCHIVSRHKFAIDVGEGFANARAIEQPRQKLDKISRTQADWQILVVSFMLGYLC